MNGQYGRYKALVEAGLEKYLPHTQIPQIRLLDAMTYSVLGAGKRIRPVLTLAFCDALGGNLEAALPFACAAEMIHAYSLIHDDLPCMDDDDVRRGRPSNHRMFGEGGAVLAGDALLSAAFETVLDADYIRDTPPERVISAAHRLAWASGLYGMAGGQQLDMDADALEPGINTAAQICMLKTAALIDAAAVNGCELAGGTREQCAHASSYARCLGLAFQIRDDLLDGENGSETSDESDESGESGESDEARRTAQQKLTLASLVGSVESLRIIEELTHRAEAFLEPFPERAFLVWFVRMLADREN